MAKPETILLTSTSERRKRTVEYIFDGSEVVQVPGSSVEAEIPNIERVALNKVLDAFRDLKSNYGTDSANCVYAGILRDLAAERTSVLAVAADVNNVAGGVDYFSKPATLKQARVALQKTAMHGFYDIVAATAIKNGLFVSGTDTSRVTLNQTGRKALQSKEGQDMYMAYVSETYGSQVLLSLSGGLMLEALLALRWIESVNTSQIDSKESELEIASALNLALTSIVPGVIGMADVRSGSRVKNNPLILEAVQTSYQNRYSKPQ